MSQRIGLEAILDLGNWNRGVSQYHSSVDGMNKKTTSLSSILGGAGKAMAGMGIAAAGLAAGAVVGLTKALASCVGPASDLNENMNKVTVVFGKSAPKIIKWSKGSAKALGMSQKTALGAVGTYGNLFTAMGLGAETSADMSTSLVQLAADLGSFNNMAPEEVLEKLRAGLTGESEPLKELGINMNEATLKTQAFKMGLISSTKEALDPAVKAQAAYALIFEQSATAQGDFARTSDGLANQQKILKAKFEEIKATVGTALLPSLTLIGDKLIAVLDSPQVQAAIKNITNWLETKLPTAVQKAFDGISSGYGKVRGILVELGMVQPKANIGALAAGFDVFKPGATEIAAAAKNFSAIGDVILTGAKRQDTDVWNAFTAQLRAKTVEESTKADTVMRTALNTWLETNVWLPIKDWFASLWPRIKALWSEFWSGDIFLRGLDLYGSTVPNSSIGGGTMTQPAMTGLGAGMSSTTNNSVGGDTIVQNISDPVSFYLAQALVQDRKRTRWNAAMGVQG